MNRTLGPRNLGDILRETFTIYKNNFLRLAIIISIVAVPSAIIGLIFNLLSPAYGELTPEAMAKWLISMVILFPLALAAFVASVLLVGAVIHGVSEQYFNRPISIGRAYSFAWHRLGGMLGAVILAGLAITGIFVVASIAAMIAAAIGGSSEWLAALVIIAILFLIAVPASVYFAITWAFVWQTALLESCGPTGALSRSSALAKQSWWRVLGITLLLYIIMTTIVMILYAPAMIGMVTWSLSGAITGAISQPPAWILIMLTIGTLIGNIITTPIFAIGETLLYFDLRVRKQGYSLDALANELGLANAPTGTGASLPE
jgi:MFS family permease